MRKAAVMLACGCLSVIAACGILNPTNRPSVPPSVNLPPAGQSVRAAFYYPWFPESWTQQNISPFTHYHPAAGLYDSANPRVIDRHIAEMQYGHIQVGISSWQGAGSLTDSRVPALLSAAAAHHFHWALYYEPEGVGDPSPAQIQADLAYIKAKYAANPAYAHRQGKPVLFVYDAGKSTGCSKLARWHAASLTAHFYVVQKVFSDYRGCAYQPDSWHQYDPASATEHQPGYAYNVSPGFYKAGEAEPRLARDIVMFDADVRRMVASHEPWNLVTTFNEWGEGTAVEPATEWSSSSGYGSYLDVLHTIGSG